MPNIFGAGLLDILSQGGQFLSGRQEGQRERKIEDDERQQKALEQALLARQREASIALDQARTTDLLAPELPKPLTDTQTRGALATHDTDESILQAFPNADPLVIAAMRQQRDDQTAAQDRAEEAGNRATASQDRATATAERVTDQAATRQQEDAARGYASVYAKQALAQPGNEQAIRSGAVAAIKAAHPNLDQGAIVAIVNDTFAQETQRARPAGGGVLGNIGAALNASGATAPTSAPSAPAASGDTVQEISEAQEAVAQGMPATQVWSMMSPEAQAQIGDPSRLGR